MMMLLFLTLNFESGGRAPTMQLDDVDACGKDASREVRLYRATDGKKFERWEARWLNVGYPNEAALVFDPRSAVAWCLLRRDDAVGTAQFGVSQPPYKDDQGRDLGVKLGGPQMQRLPSGQLVAVVRLYDRRVRTAVGVVDPATAKFTEHLALPSGGDTSYAGMVWHDDRLWISYYSSHEGRTAIDLAWVRVSATPPGEHR
jgi:hypothetical protein